MVQRLSRRQLGYTASMPMIFGIGLTLLLQWLILLPAMVVAYRKLGPVLFGSWTKT